MAEGVEVVGLVGGELMSSTGAKGKREVVLALPLARLLVKMVRVPAENEADISGYLTPILNEMSPYPDDPLTVGWETVTESERGRLVLAAALPESSADDIGEKLDAAKVNVTRIDALVLGELRALWSALAPEGGSLGDARRLLLIEGADGLEMIVLDGDVPSAIRAVPAGANLRREAMLSLMEAEDFGGAKPLAEILTVVSGDAVTPSSGDAESLRVQQDSIAPSGDAESLRVQQESTAPSGDAESLRVQQDLAILQSLAPLRAVAPVSVQASLEAVAARAADPNGLDARPQSWREVLDETRFKAKLVKGVSIAVGVWLVVMGVLFGVPMVYGYMTDYQKGLSKHHARAYKEVCDMKDKVLLVRKYSDHARGALEMLKAVSDRLPEDVEVDGYDFKRADGLSFSGVADDPKSVYALKDALTALGDDAGNKVFGSVKLGRLSALKGKQKFTLECRYEAEEEE